MLTAQDKWHTAKGSESQFGVWLRPSWKPEWSMILGPDPLSPFPFLRNSQRGKKCPSSKFLQTIIFQFKIFRMEYFLHQMMWVRWNDFQIAVVSWHWLGVIFFHLKPRRRIGVAIGEYVLDLGEISDLFTGPVMSQRKQVIQEVSSLFFFTKPAVQALLSRRVVEIVCAPFWINKNVE